MEWKDVGNWLKSNAGSGAALVGSLLTGNVPGAIAAGMSMVASATGQTQPDQALAALQGDPEALIRLKEIAHKEEASIREHIAAMEKARLEDVSDARKRDVEFLRAGKTNTRANFMVAMDVIGLLASLVGMLALGWFKSKHPDAITEGVFGALLAQLSTLASYFGLCLRDAHQFEFGSSRGSKEKGEVIAQAKL